MELTMQRMRRILVFAMATAMLGWTEQATADCVFGAKSKTSFTRLDSHTIILSGGYGRDILVKTFCFIYSSSNVTVLKDSFCSYESAVLYVDGEVCDARSVQKLD
jgi:hypothetical protein